MHAVLAARIDRLPPEDKRLLQVASVVGKDVPGVLLQTIAERPDEALRRGLDHLQAAEFLYETPSIQTSSILSSTRSLTRWHMAACYTIAAGTFTRGSWTPSRPSIPTALASMSTASPTMRRGPSAGTRLFEYLHRAGTQAAERSAHRAAVDWLEQALVALGHLPATRDTLARGLDVRFDLHMSLFALSGTCAHASSHGGRGADRHRHRRSTSLGRPFPFFVRRSA